MFTVLIILISLIYLFCCWYFIKLIWSSSIINLKQKKLNTIMVILLPMVWCPLIYSIVKSKTGGSHDPNNRKDRNSKRGWIIQEVGEG